MNKNNMNKMNKNRMNEMNQMNKINEMDEMTKNKMHKNQMKNGGFHVCLICIPLLEIELLLAHMPLYISHCSIKENRE